MKHLFLSVLYVLIVTEYYYIYWSYKPSKHLEHSKQFPVDSIDFLSHTKNVML